MTKEVMLCCYYEVLVCSLQSCEAKDQSLWNRLLVNSILLFVLS